MRVSSKKSAYFLKEENFSTRKCFILSKESLGTQKVLGRKGMKLKKKEDKSVDASVLLRRGNKILTGADIVTECGAVTEGMAIQRLPHLGIHPIYCHQTVTIVVAKNCWLTGA